MLVACGKLQGKTEGTMANALQTVVLPLVIGAVTLRTVVARGADLVRQPQLCPDLSQPW